MKFLLIPYPTTQLQCGHPRHVSLHRVLTDAQCLDPAATILQTYPSYRSNADLRSIFVLAFVIECVSTIRYAYDTEVVHAESQGASLKVLPGFALTPQSWCLPHAYVDDRHCLVH